MGEDKIRCPCKHRKCQNRNFLQPDEVKYHLARYGFVPDYYIWDRHGEIHVEVDNSNMHCRERAQPKVDYHTMVRDAAGRDFEPMLGPSDVEESPNPDFRSKRFYDMLNAADKELWPGCSKHSQLSFVLRAMLMKAEHHMSERNYDDMMKLFAEVLPDNNTAPDNFYSTKKLLRGMGLPVEKIDCYNDPLELESLNSNDPSFTADSNLDEAESIKRIDEHDITNVGGICKKRRGIGSCSIISQLDELQQRFQTFEERFEMMMSRLSTSQSGGEIKLNDN